MAEDTTRRRRDPIATRQAILEAAVALLAKDGAEAVSLSEVAHRAGVNRGTAYQHFQTREKLIEATAQWVSDKMFRAVFGDPVAIGDRDVEHVDMVDVTERLAAFAMENLELCRVWFMQILSSPEPSSDPFWREYAGSIGRFAQTDMAQPNIDVEVLSVLTLSANFLWPVWARAHSRGKPERTKLAHRFAQEMLRFSMYGSLQPDKLPEVVARLEKAGPAPRLRLIK
jgi:AcrR family transcriptional regulator